MNLVRKLFLLCFGVLLGCLVVELLLAVTVDFLPSQQVERIEEYNSPLIVRMKRAAASWDPVAKSEVAFNNFSFRRKSTTLEKPSPESFRVMNYGDSIGYGFGMNDGAPYSDRLEVELNKSRSHHVEVLNVVRGYDPTLYSFHIRRDLQQFAPSLVMMEVEPLNDIADEVFSQFRSWDSRWNLPENMEFSRYFTS